MLPEYSHTKSASLAQISTPMDNIQNFFSRGLFFIGAPCSKQFMYGRPGRLTPCFATHFYRRVSVCHTPVSKRLYVE